MPDFLESGIVVNGTATVTISHTLSGIVWQVEQISAQVGPSSTSGNVGIFKNGNLVAPTSALTPIVTALGTKAIGQTAGQDPYLYIQSSDIIQVIVSSATNGDNVAVRAQYREFTLTDPDMIGR